METRQRSFISSNPPRTGSTNLADTPVGRIAALHHIGRRDVGASSASSRLGCGVQRAAMTNRWIEGWRDPALAVAHRHGTPVRHRAGTPVLGSRARAVAGHDPDVVVGGQGTRQRRCVEAAAQAGRRRIISTERRRLRRSASARFDDPPATQATAVHRTSPPPTAAPAWAGTLVAWRRLRPARPHRRMRLSAGTRSLERVTARRVDAGGLAWPYKG